MTKTVMMPRELTAENGAKKLLMHEFSEKVMVDCPDCLDLGRHETCDVCEGKGQYELSIYVEWTTIKAIYAMAVKNLGK